MARDIAIQIHMLVREEIPDSSGAGEYYHAANNPEENVKE